MRAWRVSTWSIALFLVVLAIRRSSPAGNAPGDGCVPGTVWEDEASGITYICIYDELYGGTRWDVLPGSRQTEGQLWLYRQFGARLHVRDRAPVERVGWRRQHARAGRTGGRARISATGRGSQPGEIRARVVIQRHSGSWYTCRDSGYVYNTATATGWIAGLDMGAARGLRCRHVSDRGASATSSRSEHGAGHRS